MNFLRLCNENFYFIMIFTILILFLYSKSKNENLKKEILISKLFLLVYSFFTIGIFIMSI